ncbi:hypothetical protein M5E87_21355 [Flavonifractor plautii]|nr:hypothetical protein M5E87_21355 [Flavonifractor plautii]
MQAEGAALRKGKKHPGFGSGRPRAGYPAGNCVEPDLKAKELKEKYGGATPAETVKAMLLPGEIEDLSRAGSGCAGSAASPLMK